MIDSTAFVLEARIFLQKRAARIFFLSVRDSLEVYRRILIACARIDCTWCLWCLLSTHRVIWRSRRMFMHVQLHKSETDLRVWLHLSTCVHWVTNGWQAACPAAGDGYGGAAGSYRPWLTHHIDPPPSYLVSAKTHSSVLTQVYYASFLPSHTTGSGQSGPPAGGIGSIGPKTSVFIKSYSLVSREYWSVFFEAALSFSGQIPRVN